MELTPRYRDRPPGEAGQSTETGSGWGLTYHISNIIAEQTDTDIYELPPLYESIDPDALDAFL